MLSWGPSQYQFDPGEEQGSLKGAVPLVPEAGDPEASQPN